MLDKEHSIRASFEIFKPDLNDVIEIRSVDGYTFSGYYKDREKLFKDIMRNDDKTWYFVMNKINEACYSREQNERVLSSKKIKTTSDSDITEINWILVDCDPVRASGVSASDVEKNKSLIMSRKIYTYLKRVGFSEPVVCDSGNGYHLLYSVRMMPQHSETIKKFLQALDMMFSDESVSIDTSVFNPARITKVYGTIARKGANTTERPHRASGIITIPDEIKFTSIQLVNKVCEVIPEPIKPSYKNNYHDSFDIDRFIIENHISVAKDITVNGCRKIILESCPFNPQHKAPDSAIFVRPGGAIGFKCFHNSCSGNGWKELRKLYDKDYLNRLQSDNRYRPDYKPNASFQTKKDVLTMNSQQSQKQSFYTLNDIENYDRSKIISLKTGITMLDKKIIGLNKGELSIWSGGNGSGKSTLLSQLALEFLSAGYNVALFSGELTSSRVKNWLALQAAGRQNTRLSDNGVSYYVPKDIVKKISDWASDKLWIYNNECGLNIENVLEKLIQHLKTHSTDVVIIDNLMSIDMRNVSGDKYDKQALLVLKFSELAKQYNIHINFVCHPRKPNGFLRKADISGSQNISDAADNVFMIHRVNRDFIKSGGEYLGAEKISEFKDYGNVIEIMKNRDLGVQDELIGLYYEKESKRLLNEEHENKVYGWEDISFMSEIESAAKEDLEDLPFF